MEGVLTTVIFAVFGWSLIGLFKPRLFGLPSRWAAAALMGFSCVLVGLATEVYPTPGVENSEGTAMTGLVVWAGISSFVIFMRVAFRADRLIKSDNAAPRGDEFVERLAMRWAQWAKRTRARLAVPSPTPAENRAGLDDIQDENRKRTQEWIAANRDQIGRELQRKMKQQRKAASLSKPVQSARPSQTYNVTRSGVGTHLCSAPPGHTLAFAYRDERGDFSERCLSRWTEYPRHIAGWCEDRDDERLFRKDRIVEWTTGDDLLKRPGRIASSIAGGREPALLETSVRTLRVTPPVPARKKPRNAVKSEETIPEPPRDHASGWAGFITYVDAKGDESARRIVVKRIEGYGKAETISAYCCERNANRRFLVSGIRELICADTGEVLDPQTHFDTLAQEGAVGSTDKSMADLITIIVFLARCDGAFHPLEMESLDQALTVHMVTFGGEPKTIRKAAKKARELAPDGEDFLAALSRIGRHPRRAELAELVLTAAEDVIEADGKVLDAEEGWFDAVLGRLEDMTELEVA